MKFNATPLSLNVIHLVSVLLGLTYIILFPVTWTNIAMIGIGYFCLACIGNAVFYHRFVSHRSFETYKIIEYIGIIFGILAGRGSPIDWAGMHRYHHKHSDTELDPHDPRQEGWKLFFPYLLKYDGRITPFIIKDLLRSKFHKFTAKYYNLILLAFGITLALVNFQLFIFLWIIPMALTGFMLSLSTYTLHRYGYRNYVSNDLSKNNWIMAILFWGEGWHNNHHAKPADYSLQNNWWEIDISGLIIELIKKR